MSHLILAAAAVFGIVLLLAACAIAEGPLDELERDHEGSQW